MGQTAEIKRHCMHLRLDAETRRMLEPAAADEETGGSDFVLANAAAAKRVIDSHEKITLSPKDWEVFHDALINPPEPNEKLKKAARPPP